MSGWRLLLSDSLVYGGANALSKALNLITFPILTRIFSSEAYGTIDAIVSYGSVAATLVVFGLDSAVARFYYEHEGQTARIRLISQAFFAQLVFSAVFLALAFPLSGWISQILIDEERHANSVRIFLLTLPFIIMDSFFKNLLKWTFRKFPYVSLSLGTAVAVAAMTPLYCVWLEMGIEGVFLAQLTAFAISSLIGWTFCKRELTYRAGIDHLRSMVQYAWPYCLNGVMRMSVPALDRLFLIQFASLHSLGLYAAGYKIANLLSIPIMAFQTAWGPFSYSIYKRESAGRTYSEILLMYTLAFCLGMLLFSYLAHPLLSLLASEKFSGGAVVAVPIGFALFLESLSWIAGIGIDLSKRSYLASISYGIGLVLTLLFLWVLVPHFGIAGAAYAILAAKVFQSVAYATFGILAYKTRISWQWPAIILSISFPLCLAISTLYTTRPLEATLLTTTAVLIFLGANFVAFRKIKAGKVRSDPG